MKSLLLGIASAVELNVQESAFCLLFGPKLYFMADLIRISLGKGASSRAFECFLQLTMKCVTPRNSLFTHNAVFFL